MIYWHYFGVDQGVVGRVPEAQTEVVDADHRGQQVLLLAAVHEQHCEHLICTFDGLLYN